MMDIIDKIDRMIEGKTRRASAENVAKARKPTVGMLRPREVSKKDRVRKEKKKEKRQVKKMLKQYY